jgi:ketosteroid isomerase-like protein
MSAVSNTSPDVVRRFVDAFADGWRAPHPHAWDDLLADDVVLRQPLLPHRHDKRALAEEYARLLRLMPDLRGQVTGWTASGNDGDATVVIQLQLTTTLGRRQIVLPLVDVCRPRNGLLHERTTYLDPTPAVAALLRTPSAWTRWWRSGGGPFTGRRHLTAASATVDVPTALAIGRLALGIPAWAAPRLAAAVYGLGRPADPTVRYLVTVYGARASALGAASLLAPLGRVAQVMALTCGMVSACHVMKLSPMLSGR